MYKIKQLLEDFIVEERTSIKASDKGSYVYFFVTKKNYTTYDVATLLAKILEIPLKRISFAGNKDRHGITTQLFSFYKVSRKRIEKLKLKDIKLKFYGYGNKPVLLGCLLENKFKITIRNLTKKELDKALKKIKEKKLEFVNFFGKQRFSKYNVDIGRFIVKKEFDKAVKFIIKNEKKYSKLVEEHLKERKNDYIGALRKLPKQLIKLYVHAYQSYLWNEIAKKVVKKVKENVVIPVIGFGFEREKTKNSVVKKAIDSVLKKEGINERDFIIKQLPEASSYGNARMLFAKPKRLRVLQIDKDELNKKKYKLRIRFNLDKGVYATVFIDWLFS